MAISPALDPLHLGALHPYEHALTLLVAFGPFVLLAVVIAVRRRQDAAYDEEPHEADPHAEAGSEVGRQRDR